MGFAHCLGSLCWPMDGLPLVAQSAWFHQVICLSFIVLLFLSIILYLSICDYSVTILAQDVGGWGRLNLRDAIIVAPARPVFPATISLSKFVELNRLEDWPKQFWLISRD